MLDIRNRGQQKNKPKQSCINRLIISYRHISEIGDHVKFVVQQLSHVITKETIHGGEPVVFPTKLLKIKINNI